jgi:hypothetical protein
MLRALPDNDPNFARVVEMQRAEKLTLVRLAGVLRLTPRSNREPSDAREETRQQPWQRDDG